MPPSRTRQLSRLVPTGGYLGEKPKLPICAVSGTPILVKDLGSIFADASRLSSPFLAAACVKKEAEHITAVDVQCCPTPDTITIRTGVSSLNGA